MTKWLVLGSILTIVILYFIINRMIIELKSGNIIDNESPIDFVVVLSRPLKLSDDELSTVMMNNFNEQWGASIICEEMTELSDPSKNIQQFLLTDKTNNLNLTYSEQPLDDKLSQLLIDCNPSLSNEQREALINSKASIRVHSVLGKSTPSIKQAEIALKVVFNLLNLPESVGYSSLSGQFYRTKDYIIPLKKLKALTDNDILLLGTCMHSTQDEEDRIWIHTHGMEQFGVPDLQVKFNDESKTEYFDNIIMDAALYLMDKGPVMKPGHTFELAGDGIIYRIKAVTGEDSHFGKHGALEIERDPLQKPAGYTSR